MPTQIEQNESEEQLSLQVLRRLTDESFADLEQGKHTSYTVDTLDDFFARINHGKDSC